MTEHCDISFITLNYNGFRDTTELIESIHRVVKSVSYEILVADNASNNQEGKRLQALFPDITVIFNSTNLGFAGGNNAALASAKGEYLFFINNDTIIKDDHLNSLIESCKTSKKVGMACPKIKFLYEDNIIQYAGFTPLSRITLRNKGIGYGEEDHGQYDTAHETYFAHGAAMMIPRSVLDDVGPMSEDYFLYYEEMDWSEHIRKAGYSIWYEPACTIYHKESQVVGANSPQKNYYLTRNRLLFAKRNRKSVERILCYSYLTLACLTHALTEKNAERRNAILKGIVDFYKKC